MPAQYNYNCPNALLIIFLQVCVCRLVIHKSRANIYENRPYTDRQDKRKACLGRY
jgi:hypothetical protein